MCLNIKGKSIKFLQENTGVYLHNLEAVKIFYSEDSESNYYKRKNDMEFLLPSCYGSSIVNCCGTVSIPGVAGRKKKKDKYNYTKSLLIKTTLRK